MYLAEVNEKVLRKRLKEDGRNELLAELITKKSKQANHWNKLRKK